MQKVESSSLFSRFVRKPSKSEGFLVVGLRSLRLLSPSATTWRYQVILLTLNQRRHAQARVQPGQRVVHRFWDRPAGRRADDRVRSDGSRDGASLDDPLATEVLLREDQPRMIVFAA
jgi:hypothetical protein